MGQIPSVTSEILYPSNQISFNHFIRSFPLTPIQQVQQIKWRSFGVCIGRLNQSEPPVILIFMCALESSIILKKEIGCFRILLCGHVSSHPPTSSDGFDPSLSSCGLLHLTSVCSTDEWRMCLESFSCPVCYSRAADDASLCLLQASKCTAEDCTFAKPPVATLATSLFQPKNARTVFGSVSM